MKTVFTVLLCLCSLAKLSAQYNTNQNKVWTFGEHAGIDFRSGTPVPIVSGITVHEGSASVSNAAGLLFYTDGNIVYNRLGMVMPNGSAIAPFAHSGSTTQGAVIVPFISDTNKYFIFSLEGLETYAGHVAYSIVDMTLAGGLGDVVASSTVILPDSGMSEKMISVRGNSCDIWLIVHKKDTALFYAYNVNAAGVNPIPVISNVGTFSGINGYALGTMKCSHDRQKIVTATTVWGTVNYGVELYDFDATTGLVSNCRVLDANPMFDDAYGVEFSPDDTKLYTTGEGIIQWNISLPTLATIISSKTTVCSLTTISDLRLGPDGKIYYNSTAGNFLARIDFPNIAGTGCGCSPTAIPLAPSSHRYGLPNQVWSVQHAPVAGTTSICVGMTSVLTAPWSGVTWSTGDTGVVNLSASGTVTGIAPGTAVVSYTGNVCKGAAIVTVNVPPTPITGPTQVCAGASITLSNALPGGTWSATSGIASINATTGILTGITPGSLNITYTDPSGSCSVMRTDTVKLCKTIVDLVNKDKHIELYPNPATNEITIRTEPSAFTSCTIYNAVGQLMSTYEIIEPEMKVGVKALPPGEYQVIFTGNGAREMTRFTRW